MGAPCKVDIQKQAGFTSGSDNEWNVDYASRVVNVIICAGEGGTAESAAATSIPQSRHSFALNNASNRVRSRLSRRKADCTRAICRCSRVLCLRSALGTSVRLESPSRSSGSGRGGVTAGNDMGDAVSTETVPFSTPLKGAR